MNTDLYLNSEEFHKIGYEYLEFFKEIYGTSVRVRRLKISEKANEVYGSLFNSEVPYDESYEEFEAVIIIPTTRLVKQFNLNSDPFEIYEYLELYKIGDIVELTYNQFLYKWKFESMETQTFGKSIVYKYTLIPIVENVISE